MYAPTMLNKGAQFISALLIIGSLAMGMHAFVGIHRPATASLPTPPAPPSSTPSADGSPDADIIEPAAWSAFRFSGEAAGTGQHDQYRLAGTFFMMASTPGAEPNRRAIIDDVAANRQYIVSEGDDFQGYEIVRIQPDKLIMRKDAAETILHLSFTAVSTANANAEAAPGPTSTNTAETVLENTRFGQRVGEKRWVLQKTALADYYRELLDNPERIIAVYASMKEDVDEQGGVNGYRLQQEGEADFFKAVGLQEGDVIRTVNSMRMTSQARAEYFLSEFVQNRLGAVVLDIERNGQPDKLIYFLR